LLLLGRLRWCLSWFLDLCPHSSFNFLQTHHLPSSGWSETRCSSRGILHWSGSSLWRNSPKTRIHLHIGNISGFLVSLISASCWLWSNLGESRGCRSNGGGSGDWLLPGEPQLLFVDCTRDLCSLTKEIEVLSNWFCACSWASTSKGIIVEHIIRLVQLIS